MRRVVITGYGIVSSIGVTREAVLESLREGRSGICTRPEYIEVGLRSHIAGSVEIDLDARVDRRMRRFMGDAAAYASVAMEDAIAHAGLEPKDVSNDRTGLIAGSGGASPSNQVVAVDILRTRGIRKVSPFMVPRTMNSTTTACLATQYKIRGHNYTITSACATGAHCIGHAAELIQLGKQDIVFAGGGEEEHWSLTMMFDAMGALSTGYNDTPDKASRAFCTKRDGFVIAGGGGIVVVEEREHAIARGANIIAELVGYGATSDGVDMVAPSGEGAVRCMRQALATAKVPVGYVNAHGTSTPAGDSAELRALKEVFGGEVPLVSSTKSLTGHSLGAAGVQEAIYSLLMLEHDFVAASANIEDLDPAAEGVPVVRERRDNAGLQAVLSNSFGFGGTNASLIFARDSA